MSLRIQLVRTSNKLVNREETTANVRHIGDPQSPSRRAAARAARHPAPVRVHAVHTTKVSGTVTFATLPHHPTRVALTLAPCAPPRGEFRGCVHMNKHKNTQSFIMGGYTQTNKHRNTHTHKNKHTHTHTRARTHTHRHTHTHTQTRTRAPLCSL